MGHQPRRSIPFQQLLKHLHLGIVENPLRRIPEDRLNVYIKSFHEESDLAKAIDIHTLIRGARLARDEEGFITEETAKGSLTEVEREALQEGRPTSIWRESREIKIILLTCCVASVAQGWISSSFIPALALLLLVFVGSESPRWLIKKKRYREAYSVLLRLRENPLLAARDLVFIWAQLQVETTLFMRTNTDVIDLENRIPYLDPQVYLREIGLFGYARRITQLFTIPRARRATLASFIVMLAQQMSGINVFAFLASTLFEYDNQVIPNRGSLWLYFGFGIANFL
ncbi:MAG: hypothetical protein Q9181_002952 [Wetmoreana brouardii]